MALKYLGSSPCTPVTKATPSLRGEKGIFAVGFLPASPARIAKDVDVGRPEIQAEEDAVVPFPLRLVVLGPSFGGNRLALAVDQVAIPCRGHADGLREHGGISRTRHAVQRFTPPIVGGNAEPGDGRRGVLHLPDLLLKRHARDEIVNTLFQR